MSASITNHPAPRKVVLITGASSGIGQACAEHLARSGWRVFGTGRGAPPAVQAGAAFEMVTMDVDDDNSVGQAVESVLAKAGRLDAVVNNAGIAVMGAVEDTSIEEAKAQLETNFFGALRVCRATLPALRKQGGGHVINISSLAGIIGLPFSGLYSASKFALEGVSESLRMESRAFGIHVVLVEPGDFRTNITTRRRIAAAAETNDAYREAFERCKQKQEQDETNAPGPEAVARLVGRILNDPRPRTRYSVGMLSQRMVVPLKRFLPQRLFEWAARRAFGM
ncbi:MAG TPA: SDR family oxidoreductase [Planctomycetaceae bacterium]|jgi:NAD(P)-dependent dehydrogenase (short-subunit alcohol dehydrogenase family)|nr:SDR family oxidoreductase [Planctomycetaceae bacterium]